MVNHTRIRIHSRTPIVCQGLARTPARPGTFETCAGRVLMLPRSGSTGRAHGAALVEPQRGRVWGTSGRGPLICGQCSGPEPLVLVLRRVTRRVRSPHEVNLGLDPPHPPFGHRRCFSTRFIFYLLVSLSFMYISL